MKKTHIISLALSAVIMILCLDACKTENTMFEEPQISQASAVIMQYTGYSSVSEFDPPTYSCVGSDNGIASWRTMQNSLQRLSQMGISTGFHVYDGLGHGFGIGTGTVADGWAKDAIEFWESNMITHGGTGVSPVYDDI